jgi:hypothetical protein
MSAKLRENWDNTGILFKNQDKKDKESKLPDYKGELQVGGKWYWLNAWIKQGKKEKFMSLTVVLKDIQKSQFDP